MLMLPPGMWLFCLLFLILHPSSTLSVWEGSWQTPVPNPAETSTEAGRGVRGGAGTSCPGPLWKWGLYDCSAFWLWGMASRRGSSLDANFALVILDNRESLPHRGSGGWGGFVPVQPSNSLGLSQGLQGTCSSFQQSKQPPISRRAFQPDKARQAAAFL